MIEPSTNFVGSSQGTVSANGGVLEVLLKIDDSDYLKKKDGVSKEYVDNIIKSLQSYVIYSMRNISPLFLKYFKIKNKYNPAFWLSSKFPKGLEEENDNITDLSGNGLTRTGTTIYSRSDGFLFDMTNSLTSNASFNQTYTFLLKENILTLIEEDFLLVLMEINF